MPAYRKSAGRQVDRVDGVSTYRYPLDGHDLPGLLAFAEQVLEPSAVSFAEVEAGTSVVTLVLSGTAQVEPWPGERRVLGPLTSLVHATVEQGRRVVANPADSEVTRLVEVTVSGATRTSLSLHGDHARINNATIRLGSSYYGSGPGVVLVCDGYFENEAVDPLHTGDWLELDGGDGDWAFVEGEGRLLIIDLDGS